MTGKTPATRENAHGVYVARSYYVGEDRSRSYREEAVFSTYEEAYDFLQCLEGEDECNNVRFEIYFFLLGDREPWERRRLWSFDRMMNLLDSIDEASESRRDYDESCAIEEGEPGKFSAGDIVLYKETPRTEFTKGVADRIAVIHDVPGPRMHHEDMVYFQVPEQLPEGAELFWSKLYTVWYIDCFGYIEHNHPREDELEAYIEPLPPELAFLQTFANHVTGKRRIREKSLEALFNGRLFVENVRHFSEEDDLEPRRP